MANLSDYDDAAVSSCFSVLLEFFTILGEYRESLVLVGGWTAPLIMPVSVEKHIGTTDIDVMVDFRQINDMAYETILKLLGDRGYVQDENMQHRYLRELGGGSVVAIDFLAGEYGGTGRSRRHQRIQDLMARKARGGDLVFDNYVDLTIKGKLPNGAVNEVGIRVAGVVPFLTMKGMALWTRYDEKDAYDICYVLKNCPSGIEGLRLEFEPFLENGLVVEGLGKIRAKFDRVDGLGPSAYADFMRPGDEDERELLRRDAFMRVNSLLDSLGVQPYKEE